MRTAREIIEERWGSTLGMGNLAMAMEAAIHAAMAEAFRHAASLCDDYDSTDELRPILDDLAELEADAVRPAGEVG